VCGVGENRAASWDGHGRGAGMRGSGRGVSRGMAERGQGSRGEGGATRLVRCVDRAGRNGVHTMVLGRARNKGCGGDTGGPQKGRGE